MTGKLKYFIALAIVMCLIYTRGDFVIYAGGTAQKGIVKENVELTEGVKKFSKNGKNMLRMGNVGEGGNAGDEGSGSGGSAGDGGENSGGGTGDSSGGDSGGSGGEDTGDGGDSSGGGSGESGGGDTGDSGDSGEGDGSGEDTGDGEEGSEGDTGNEGEEKPPVPEKKPIEEYEIKIPETDGKAGYYVRKPEVVLKHVSERGVTRYCLTHGDKKLAEKTLKVQGEKSAIGEKEFVEGKNILHIWMEDEEGKKLEKFEMKKEFLIDTQAPEISMSVPKGFEAWYQGQVVLSVKGEDTVSQIEKIICKSGDKVLGNTDKAQGEFLITQASQQEKGAEVTVIAQDKAGNKSERVKRVYIDNRPPRLKLSGVKNYTITGHDVLLSCEAEEENKLQEYYAEIIWENVKGKRKTLSVSDWEGDGIKKTLSQKLDKDGTYYIKVYVKDVSGQDAAEELQITIDKTDPVIQRVETLRGKYLKKFQWNYPPYKMIWDFTTYSYEIRIDGWLYHIGKTIDSEGPHKMTVRVTDAAGNHAQVSAGFVIDHTAPEIIFDNVEDGGEYEEERTFNVKLKGTGDTIRQIQINGEKQKMNPGKNVYEYALHTCKDYEVVVKASDMAGNLAEETIYFQIIPKKTFAKSVADKVLFHKDMPKSDGPKRILKNREKQQENRKSFFFRASGIGLLGVILAISAVLIWGRRRWLKNEAEIPIDG